MALTYHDLKFNTRQALAAAGLENPELEAQEIVCVAAGKNKEELLRDLDLYMNDEIAQQVEQMVQRRCEGEPLPYVLGEWSFRGLDLEVGPSVLIPRLETEMLAQLAIDRLGEFEGNTRVLDLCSGTGCVGLSIAAEVPTARTVLMEYDDEALDLCRRNIRRNRLSIRAVPMKGNVLEPPNPALGLFDVLVCNPPYIPSGDIPGLDPSVRDYEPHIALDGGPDGLDFYRAVINLWTPLLHPGGYILFEVGIGQAEEVAMLLKHRACKNIVITRDFSRIPRVVTAKIPYILRNGPEDQPEADAPERQEEN